MFLSCLHCCHPTKHRFSAKEGATRPDQARPRTNIQVFSSFTSSYCWVESDTQLRACCEGSSFVSFSTLCQTLDGKFGEGESEAHGKFSAKEGVRPNQARPQTNMQVRVEFWIFSCWLKIHFSMSQPHGRAEGESETRDRQNSLLGNFQNEKRLAQV